MKITAYCRGGIGVPLVFQGSAEEIARQLHFEFPEFEKTSHARAFTFIGRRRGGSGTFDIYVRYGLGGEELEKAWTALR
ncbi:MAG: hypothetical protein IT209_12285 [Armatimonadetes bacterium]|nr:hypothetical protein [Armatimonadota bacterium]